MQNPSTMPGQPQLGTPIPGTTGGLPALSGLSITQNPMARELQSYGRGDDSMLVHMTPAEVNSLQGLALATGGSLTINPHTGLPEAGWLGKLLPTLLGFGLNFIPGIGPLAAAGITAAGATAVTGDLKKGLMAGLQAYGGAGLSGALAPAATAGAAGKVVAQNLAEKGLVEATKQGLGAAGVDVAKNAALNKALQSQVTKVPGFLGRFGVETAMGTKGLLAKALPMAAGSAVLGAVSDATQPKFPTYKPEEPGLKYTPMAPLQRKVRFQTPEQMEASGGAEYQYYTPVNPEPVPLSQVQQQPEGFADGGDVTAAPDFNSLVAAYSANNPGAITASMKYPTSAPPAIEQKYNFRPTAPTVTPTPGTGVGSLDPSNLNIGNYDLSNISIPGFDWETVRDNLGINQIQQQLQQQNAQSPILNIEAPDFSGIYDRFGAIESKLQSLPTELPTYEAPDLSGVYGRLDELGSRVQSLPTQQPTYEAPDLSGIYDRFGALESKLNAIPTQQPTYEAPDLSGIYDRFGAIESKLNAIPTQQPTYQAPDLSGIYDRFGQLESRINSLPTQQPTYQAPDLSGIYDRFGALESKLNSMPTYQAPDLSGLYGRLDQLESRLSSAPTYESGPAIYDMNADQYQTVGGFARGGDVNMRDGAFVVDARTVSELGNGSSNAGMELLSRMGGQPVRGPGDGVSDSVPASIGGKQEARVARDEVIFQPDAVRRIGGGSEKRGTQKLYALMDKAHKARKKAKRGQDTGVRRGLA